MSTLFSEVLSIQHSIIVHTISNIPQSLENYFPEPDDDAGVEGQHRGYGTINGPFYASSIGTEGLTESKLTYQEALPNDSIFTSPMILVAVKLASWLQLLLQRTTHTSNCSTS